MALNNVEQGFRVTDNQRFIVSTALNTLVHQPLEEEAEHDVLVDVFSRMMVVIQSGGLQSYFRNGFESSCRSRLRAEPEQVLEEKARLSFVTDHFSQRIMYSRGKEASRIRANRARLRRAGFGWMLPGEGYGEGEDEFDGEQFEGGQFEPEARMANLGHEPLGA